MGDLAGGLDPDEPEAPDEPEPEADEEEELEELRLRRVFLLDGLEADFLALEGLESGNSTEEKEDR